MLALRIRDHFHGFDDNAVGIAGRSYILELVDYTYNWLIKLTIKGIIRVTTPIHSYHNYTFVGFRHLAKLHTVEIFYDYEVVLIYSECNLGHLRMHNI